MASQASDSIRPKPRTTLADELAVVAQRAQSFTNASGAAIAIGEDNAAKDEIICRARSGPSAPDVGVALRLEGTFTGLCIQSGKEMRCDDAESDARVDMTAIRSLGIRSMVVTPIRDQGKVTGVLAVFAPLPNAFTITHVAVLKTMADQISGLLQKDRLVKDQPITAPTVAATPSAPAPQAAVPLPPALPRPITAAEPPKPARLAVPLPPPVVIKSPAASLNAGPTSTASMSAASAAAVAPARTTTASVPNVEAKPLSLADDISAPMSVTTVSGTTVPGTKIEERREHKPEPTAPMAKPSFGTLDAVAAKPSGSSGKFILIGLAVAVVVGGAAWFYLGTQRSRSQEPAQPQAQAQSATPSTSSAANAAAPVSESIASAPSQQPAPVHSKASAPERTEDKRAVTRKPVQEEPAPTPATVSINGGQSKIAVRPADQSPDVSPSLAVGGSGSNGLSALARPVNTAVPGRVSQSDLVNAAPIHTVPAAYPELAKSRGISGDVVVRVLVGKDGKPSRPVLVSGPVIFRDSAFDAVKQWVFKPARLNGQPVEQETEIHMKFHP
jgi:TonB family protein